jgi:hypothetical protein
MPAEYASVNAAPGSAAEKNASWRPSSRPPKWKDATSPILSANGPVSGTSIVARVSSDSRRTVVALKSRPGTAPVSIRNSAEAAGLADHESFGVDDDHGRREQPSD